MPANPPDEELYEVDLEVTELHTCRVRASSREDAVQRAEHAFNHGLDSLKFVCVKSVRGDAIALP
jgi:thioester reductase-like protein